ncbi:MAG: alcohol dehydrogenase catalytic domain-containing protein [Chloroflexi bacterium]|nr:alcohol dehydrogenase catalytic domain-containing protein [Chloroflexota bacterium]
MKAVVKPRPEPGIELREVPVPTPKAHEVLLKVEACGVCGSDLQFYQWSPEGRYITTPLILGHEPSGVIAEVGAGVTEWRVGDRVVFDSAGNCGQCYYCRLGRFNLCERRSAIGTLRDGAMAEYVAIPTAAVYRIPDNVSFEEAAAFVPLGLATRALERSLLKPGDDVVVMGPGPVGMFTALVARAAGAGRLLLTGRGVDRERLALAERLGIQTLNVEAEDGAERISQLTEGRGADVVFECAGALPEAITYAKKGGQVVAIGFSAPQLIDPKPQIDRELTISWVTGRPPGTWQRALKLAAAGLVPVKPLITHTFPIEQAEEAFRLVQRREALKVILKP